MEHIACDLCGSDNADELYPDTMNGRSSAASGAATFRCTSSAYGIHPRIVRCRVCGLVYANPRRDPATIRDHYEQVVDITYVEESMGRILTFRRYLKELEGLLTPETGRRLLDVGCYTGIFLKIAKQNGWQAHGVELSRWAVDLARQQGLTVLNGTLADVNFPDNYFDVVTMWDVIEHLSSPSDDLRETRRVLKPGGLLCIHTLDVESSIARLMGRYWPWLMEMHLYYFSRETLSRMLTKTGFELLEAKSQGRFIRLGYLTTRLEGLKVPGMGALRTILRWVGLNQVAVPISLGDLFTAYARKI